MVDKFTNFDIFGIKAKYIDYIKKWLGLSFLSIKFPLY